MICFEVISPSEFNANSPLRLCQILRCEPNCADSAVIHTPINERSMALAGRVGRHMAGRLMGAPMQTCKSLTTQSLPDLPYDYSALEPVISAEIMKLHHGKHHNTYITTLNQSYEKYADAEAKGDVAKMIELQQAIKFNGGGMQ